MRTRRSKTSFTTPASGVGYWRSVSNAALNAFAVESFVDETPPQLPAGPGGLAHGHAQCDARSQNVLKLAADKAGWKGGRQTGTRRGAKWSAMAPIRHWWLKSLW